MSIVIFMFCSIYMSAKIFCFPKYLTQTRVYGHLYYMDVSLLWTVILVPKIPKFIKSLPLSYTHLASLMQTLSISWKFDCICLYNVPKMGINQQINVRSQEAHVVWLMTSLLLYRDRKKCMVCRSGVFKYGIWVSSGHGYPLFKKTQKILVFKKSIKLIVPSV